MNWNQKIVAHLHDPPEKAYDYSRIHIERAAQHLSALNIPESVWKGKEPDHLAAAADRFIFPATRRKEGEKWVQTAVGNLGGGVCFKHPLTGQTALEANAFPGEEDAHAIISSALPDFAGTKDVAVKFWLLWRLWLQFTVEAQRDKASKAGNLAYLPADTRIPDGSIWHHMSVVSALESTRDAGGMLQPAFLTFQLGPVQEFIAQARSTRDLWSGSYLLSWMMAAVLKRLAARFGPDCVIFPSLKGQPLYDWLEQEKLKQAFHTTTDGRNSKSFWETAFLRHHADLTLTPNLPNRFLAIVPANSAIDFTEILTSVFNPDRADSEWNIIASACWNFLSTQHALPANAANLWRFQIRRFWQMAWQLWPWMDVESALDRFRDIPLGDSSPLHRSRDMASSIPDAVKDDRCYRDGKLSPGWAWSAHYQLAVHRHDARRQTREFESWNDVGTPGHKDSFSGKEEAVGTKEWLGHVGRSPTVGHLFRHDDELGAVNLIKRVWHRAILDRHGFKQRDFKFDSVLGIAAGPWKNQVKDRLEQDADVCLVLRNFMEAVDKARHLLDFDLTVEHDERRLLDRVDSAVFHCSFWEGLKVDAEEAPLRDAALELLRELLRKAKAGTPGRYYAVLALDGDEIGRWLSGEKTPAVQDVLAGNASKWFSDNLGNANASEWLRSNRPLSPSYHLQFSEALSNFGLFCARRIVNAHSGQLVYSGGDDVLALVPAGEAVACARGLRLAFQGRSHELTVHSNGRYSGLFKRSVPEGFIQLHDGDSEKGGRRPAEPSWPLLVPGPRATVSVGICIGHVKEPLQDMVLEAQAAEKRAKNEFGRNALAITLFKRSGEMIRWGTKFDRLAADDSSDRRLSASLRLLEFIQTENRYRKPPENPEFEPPIKGKFPHRLAELLMPYQEYKSNGSFGDQSQPLPITGELRGIAEKEIAWAISRQCAEMGNSDRNLLGALCSEHLLELEQAERPLSDFVHLFALEAFIARQGE